MCLLLLFVKRELKQTTSHDFINDSSTLLSNCRINLNRNWTNSPNDVTGIRNKFIGSKRLRSSFNGVMSFQTGFQIVDELQPRLSGNEPCSTANHTSLNRRPGAASHPYLGIWNLVNLKSVWDPRAFARRSRVANKSRKNTRLCIQCGRSLETCISKTKGNCT